ncbi:hypothetical protein FRACYDRAFT_250170 [Fragilariopsis cylindrus CCMP1102]|uniref:Uncharacterized protein n=1 Tax=Fragilariopsis cylindrus CCMP1102 TaxID=635003 RepID=A0A1E7ERB9_9STRA|nr:hypothetical protein FRACYDRAFT_250170 [Fragilariopsis cylindrus CCMP1102]|eukprot:OEU08377.1 hypothetical protein FRACYDRAFT_250170 [Fragilariopsis cylindrus CCMP1102]
MNTKKVEARKTIGSETITISVDSSSMSSSSSHNFGVYALIIGLCLVLYTPTWLILLSYKLDDDENVIEDTTSTSTSSSQSLLLYQFISYLILEFIPWFANAIVSIFLACLFLYLGYSNIKRNNDTTSSEII